MKTFLLSAYACEPEKGSEPGVGWNWALELAKKHKVVVITRENNKQAIQQYLSRHSCANLSFAFCDLPSKLSFFKKGQKGLHLYYFLWQICCYRLAKRMMKTIRVDYAMTVTFGNLWLPTFMHWLPCDFIWGPVGGGEGIPKLLWSRINKKQRLFERIRNFNKILPVTNPLIHGICRKSKLILVRTEDSLRCIAKKYRKKCLICIETGVSQQDIERFQSTKQEDKPGAKFDFAVVGKLSTLKQVNLAIDAFASLENCGDGKLHIMGDGPEKDRLMNLAAKNKVADQVVFYGNLEHSEVLRIMALSDAVVMPSLKEGGSWVMFEAMLLKKPMICFDHAGMSVVETNETAVLVPISQYDLAVKQFATGMASLAGHPERSREMGRKAYERVTTQLTWKHHVDRMCAFLKI